MRLEALAVGSSYCPLIRLYQFSAADISALQAACIQLSGGIIDRFDLSAQPWIDAVGGCRLTLAAESWDRGVIADTATDAADFTGGFHWFLRRGTWDNVAALLEPFLTSRDGFQWLEQAGDIGVLISRGGTW